MNVERWTVLHSFLFGLFPIAFFFAQNISQLTYGEMLIPTLLALGLSVLALLVGRAVYGNWRKGAIVASLGLFLFFSYGHVYSFFRNIEFLGVFHHRFLLPTWLALFSVGAYVLFRTRWKLKGMTGFLNVTSAAMVAISLFNVGVHEGTTNWQDLPKEGGEQTLRPIVDTLPNIYYIVPDGYASSRTLSRTYNYDNSAFESFLEENGFYVATGSLTNYPQTKLSLPSSLNMKYLDSVAVKEKDRIYDSRVVRTLTSHGYTFVNFPSGWNTTGFASNADINVHCGRWWQSEVMRTVIKTTILRPFVHKLDLLRGGWRARVPCVFNNLESLDEQVQEPFFVLAHIIAPHPPYVFGPEGAVDTTVGSFADVDSPEHRAFYLAELQYVNRRLKSLVRKIRTGSQRPSVILIQSDHGPQQTSKQGLPSQPADTLAKERMGILNSYYLPDRCSDKLYGSISPVNSFRVVLSCYFDREFALLPDRSYFSSYGEPYQFEDITDRARWEDEPGLDASRKERSQQ